MVYRTEYTRFNTLTFYWIGWKWGYAVMWIQDANGDSKIRLAKCKITRDFPETEMYEWIKLDPNEIGNLKQVQKINFKSLGELEACFKVLRNEFMQDSDIEAGNVTNEEELIFN